MPDPADVSEEQLWGLAPDAPPQIAQAPPPARTPAPVVPQRPVISEAQRWGTEALPGQTRDAPYALDVGPPPTAMQGPTTQQSVDDAREWDIAKQEEIKAYQSNPLSITDYSPVPPAFTREQHQDWTRYQQAQEVLNRMQVSDPKQFRLFKPQVDQMRKRIDTEVKARDTQLAKVRQETLKRDDAPYQSPEARDKTASVLETHVTKEIDKTIAKATSGNPKLQREGDYDLTVSGITTLSKPLPGKEKEKPNATNRDYTPLRDLSTDLATHNRGLPNDAAVRYGIMLATPGGGTDENGNPIPGYNGRFGMGATNYKVIGRDDLGNVLVQMSNGQRLRVPPMSYRTAMTARQQGAQRARTWEDEYKKSQQPGMIRRAIDWGLKSVIPEKGF